MQRTLARDLAARRGDTVQIAGFVQHARRLSRVTFLIIRDRSGLAQVVVESPSLRQLSRSVTAESVVRIGGVVVASTQAAGGVELHASSIEVLAEAESPTPVRLASSRLADRLPILLDHAAVALRHPRRRAVLEIAAAAVAGFRCTLGRCGFTEIQTPKIVPAATESGANVFRLDYFSRDAYLAQSPQFYKQIMVAVLERVYETGPVFRAEPHDTTRHLAEYVSLDCELGFINDHHDVIDVARAVISGMLASVTANAAAALALLGVRPPRVGATLPLVEFAQAQRLVQEATGDAIIDTDLAPSHERWLGGWAYDTYASDFLVVSGYPLAQRPFYTHPDPDSPLASRSFDVLFRGLEVITGGQRLHRYADYLAALEARGETAAPLAGYLEAFRYGMPPHGGFAIGLERFVAALIGASNVREVAPFPRDIKRVVP